MKIAYNPKTAAALTSAPANNDITFDLSGLSIYVRGERFKGTDTTYTVFKKHDSGDSGGYNGLVPVPNYNGNSLTRYLREDGTWLYATDVKLSEATDTDFRPIVLGLTHSATLTELVNPVTGQVYVTSKIYACPSTGILYATKLYSNGKEVLTEHQSLADYVTLNTPLTITGRKTFYSLVNITNGTTNDDGTLYARPIIYMDNSLYMIYSDTKSHTIIRGSAIRILTSNGVDTVNILPDTIKTLAKIESDQTIKGTLLISTETTNSPLVVSSSTVVAKLNSDLLDGYHASGLFEKLDNDGNNLSITIGGTKKNLIVNYAAQSGKLGYSIKFKNTSYLDVTFDGSKDIDLTGGIYYSLNSDYAKLLKINSTSTSTIATGVGTWTPISGKEYVFRQKWTNSAASSDTADLAIYLDGNLTANMCLDGYYYSLSGFKKSGSDDNYVLLGGGGHKTISSIITSGYIGTTLVLTSSKAQALSGISSINGRLTISAENDLTRLGFGGVHNVVFGEPGYAHRGYYFRPSYSASGNTITEVFIQNASAANSPTWTTTHAFFSNGNATHTGSVTAGLFIANNASGPHFTGTSTAGNWAYLRLNNGSTFWDIATRSNSGSGGLWLARLSGADNGIFVSTGNNVGISTSSPSYKLHIVGDSYTTGWSRASSGFYVENTGVHFTHLGTVGEIDMTSNNEFLWGSSNANLFFNYRGVSRGTTVTNYIWNAGSSTSYASHTLGALTSRGDLTLYGLTSTCNKGNSTSYMQSALQIREYNFGGTQSDTWAIAPRLSWHWSGRVLTQIGLASNNELYLSKDEFSHAYKLVYETGTWGINISGNADTVDGYHEYSFLRYRDTTSANGNSTLWSQIGIRSYHNALPEGLSGLYTYGQVVSLPGNGSRLDIFTNHVGSSQSNGSGGLWWRSGWNDDKHPWRRIIDSGNIGSQSVNYANYAGYLTAYTSSTNGTGVSKFYLWYDWANTGSLGTYFHGIWAGAPDGNIGYDLAYLHGDKTHLYMRSWDYGSWNSWYKICTNADTYVASDGTNRGIINGAEVASARHLLINGVTWNSNWHWSGQSGQPTWLWGSNNGTNMYVWNPSNFSVNYANSAGNADTLDGLHASSFPQIKHIGYTGDFCYDVILLCKRDEVHQKRLDGMLFTTGGGVNRYHCADVHFWHSCWSVGSYDVYNSMTNKAHNGYNFEFCTCTYGGAVWYAIRLCRIQAVSYYFMGSYDGINFSLITYYNTSSGVKNSEINNSIYLMTSNDMRYAGNIYAIHFYESSDILLKENISSIIGTDNIPILRKFNWKKDGKVGYGFIALELEELGYHELVSGSEDGTKTVHYTAALSLVVAKLQNKIKLLEKEIDILKNKN